MLPKQEVPPPPAPADYPGARRGSSSPDRRQMGREGRSRNVEMPRQGPVRRFRSTGPVDPNDEKQAIERQRIQDSGRATCGGFRHGFGRSMTTARRSQEESLLVRELEELRARSAQMEKTLR